jgi:hypothetical protein
MQSADQIAPIRIIAYVHLQGTRPQSGFFRFTVLAIMFSLLSVQMNLAKQKWT